MKIRALLTAGVFVVSTILVVQVAKPRDPEGCAPQDRDCAVEQVIARLGAGVSAAESAAASRDAARSAVVFFNAHTTQYTPQSYAERFERYKPESAFFDALAPLIAPQTRTLEGFAQTLTTGQAPQNAPLSPYLDATAAHLLETEPEAFLRLWAQNIEAVHAQAPEVTNVALAYLARHDPEKLALYRQDYAFPEGASVFEVVGDEAAQLCRSGLVEAGQRMLIDAQFLADNDALLDAEMGLFAGKLACNGLEAAQADYALISELLNEELAVLAASDLSNAAFLSSATDLLHILDLDVIRPMMLALARAERIPEARVLYDGLVTRLSDLVLSDPTAQAPLPELDFAGSVLAAEQMQLSDEARLEARFSDEGQAFLSCQPNELVPLIKAAWPAPKAQAAISETAKHIAGPQQSCSADAAMAIMQLATLERATYGCALSDEELAHLQTALTEAPLVTVKDQSAGLQAYVAYLDATPAAAPGDVIGNCTAWPGFATGEGA